MGEVEVSRRYYRNTDQTHVFLLDEAMGMGKGYGQVSENLAEQIVRECSEKSFRKASKSISTMTGQIISPQGAWDVVQEYGERIEGQEGRLKELDSQGIEGCLGRIPSEVIFSEVDDVWLSMQRPKRRKRGTPPPKRRLATRNQPLHVGTAYRGWRQQKDGRYQTVDKLAYAGFGGSKEFISTYEVLLRQRYDMDGVSRRILSGDGASWIKGAAEEMDAVLQLDPYHRNKAILQAVNSREDRRAIFAALNSGDVDGVLQYVESLIYKTEDENVQTKLMELSRYLHSNRDSLLTWQERGISIPEAPEGIVYRNLGVQESSNCNLITQRMKHLKGSWTVKGANHMAKILCYRQTIGLDAILDFTHEEVADQLSEKQEPLSAAKAPRVDGDGYSASWLYAAMPFEQSMRTHGREVIRNMLKTGRISDLNYI
jgi:hypothetical protein